MVGPAGRAEGDDFHRKVIAHLSGLELAHLLGQHPQRPVEAHPAVDAAHRARVQAAALRAATRLPATDHVLLHTLEGGPPRASAGYAGLAVLREGWQPVRGETPASPVARRAAQQPGPAQRGHARS